MRGVFDHSDYLEQPLGRLQRTATYVAATALGTVEEAERAGRLVRSIHKPVRGRDPVTGRDYSADDPESQVWVHFSQWYSYLIAHRVFVGDLTPEEEDQFVAEGVSVATLVGTPAEMIPKSLAEARAYFEEVKPTLCLTEGAVEAVRFATGRRWPKTVQQAAVLPAPECSGQQRSPRSRVTCGAWWASIALRPSMRRRSPRSAQRCRSRNCSPRSCCDE